MPTYATSDTGSQDGYRSGNNFDESTATLNPTGAGSARFGLRFKVFNGSFDAESRPLGAPRPYTSLSLTLYTAGSLALPMDLDLYFVPEAAPAAYASSATLLPGSRSEDTTGVFKDINGVALSGSTITMAAGVPSGTAATWTDLSIHSLMPYITSSSWNGYICLTIFSSQYVGVSLHSSRGTTASLHPTLTTNEVAFHTGILQGPAVGHRARSRLCPRTGLPVSSDEMVRDGYSEGLMVSPEAWDPEAPDDEYVPNPHEGVVDDEV